MRLVAEFAAPQHAFFAKRPNAGLGVDLRRRELQMSKELLHLIDRHFSGIQQNCRDRMPQEYSETKGSTQPGLEQDGKHIALHTSNRQDGTSTTSA